MAPPSADPPSPESSSPHQAGPDQATAIEIRDDMIRLGQLLKLAGIADDGAGARALLEDEAIDVNGEAESRRGRQLHPGDVVEVDLPDGVRRLRVVRPA